MIRYTTLNLEKMKQVWQRWLSSSVLTLVFEDFDESLSHEIQLWMRNHQMAYNLNLKIIER